MVAGALMIMLIMWSFSKFYPLTFGSPMSDRQCKSLKWKKKWDFVCGAEEITTEIFAKSTPVAYEDEDVEEPEVIFESSEEDDDY